MSIILLKIDFEQQYVHIVYVYIIALGTWMFAD